MNSKFQFTLDGEDYFVKRDHLSYNYIKGDKFLREEGYFEIVSLTGNYPLVYRENDLAMMTEAWVEANEERIYDKLEEAIKDSLEP